MKPAMDDPRLAVAWAFSWCTSCGGSLATPPATGCRRPLGHHPRGAVYLSTFSTNSESGDVGTRPRGS